MFASSPSVHPTLRRLALVPALAAMMLGSLAAADDSYFLEVGAVTDIVEGEDDFSATTLSLYGALHFWQVDTSGGVPLAEAAFIRRVPYVGASVGYANFEDTGLDADGSIVSATVQLWSPGIPVTGQLTVTGVNYEDDDNDITVSGSDVTANIGWWFSSTMLIGATLGLGADEIEVGGDEFETDVQTYGAFLKWVQQLPMGIAFNVEAIVDLTTYEPEDAEDLDEFTFAVAGDLYFDPRYSVGAEGVIITGDDDGSEGQILGLRAKAFINPSLFIAGKTDYFLASDEDSEDEFSFQAQLGLRF